MKVTIELRYKLNDKSWKAFIINGPERRTPSVVDIQECWGRSDMSVESGLKIASPIEYAHTTQLGSRPIYSISPEEAETRIKKWRHRATLSNLDRMAKETRNI